ncbi:glycosyl transferase family 2 [Clostridium sp. DL-VIII]|uniref:glycosyltransferase n=1 Tax=Clostridium sp. DL-VIII TaxID=641107 RepID=UPI00023B062B|nr:glycosyltransferase family 2 protein [Clostridium sp. DL-VIII]EHJ01490.1 glycosyl transferase family 2 [Clostridium sp. DL-VIII]
MLSLCMIVKDEEENLKKCLSKLTTIVDEIIIVDTGSADNTKDIAKVFTDKIYDFKWCNDFSKARNFSVSKASNDWILVLDADEFVIDFDKKYIEEFIKSHLNEKRVGRINRINAIEDLNGNKKYREKINRLFNRKYFYYEGIIHEQIIALDSEDYETESLNVTVEHIGYTEEILNKTDKLKRNIDLLETAVKNDSEDPYLYFQLGKSYYMLKDYRNSALYFEKALTFQLNFKLEYVEDLIETYGYSLINAGRYSDAISIENCFEMYSKSADFHFLMGLIYMNNAMFEKAVNSFIQCTKFVNSKVEGLTTYAAYYNIGVIYEVLGFSEKAIGYYRKCGDYEPAKNRIK